jgi:hypothetical protein
MPFEVTRSELNHIFELDGEPAWKILTDRLGEPETSLPYEIGPIYALASELPEELHEEYGNKHIIGAPLVIEPDHSMYMESAYPEGTKLWLAERNEKRIFDGLDKMVEQLIERFGDRKPVAVFHADCAARGRWGFNRVLKDEIVSRMQYPICKDENVPWLGMYGAGEFAELGGRNRLHHYTSALFPILKRND